MHNVIYHEQHMAVAWTLYPRLTRVTSPLRRKTLAHFLHSDETISIFLVCIQQLSNSLSVLFAEVRSKLDMWETLDT